jgi:hypothetical protein
MSVSPLPRPGSVTVVVVLTWISAILHLLLGVLLLIAGVAIGAAASGSGRVIGTGLAVTLAIVYLIIGLITAFVAVRLGRGGRGSRMLLTIIEVIAIITNVITWIAANSNQQAISSVFAIAFAVVILILLWNRTANDFFNATP